MAGKEFKQVESGEIDHAERPVQQFPGDTVGKKGLSDACISIEKQIVKSDAEGFRKGTAALQSGLSRLSGRKTGRIVYDIVGIIFQGKSVEILFVQNLIQPRLGIEERCFCFLKAYAFFLPSIYPVSRQSGQS